MNHVVLLSEYDADAIVAAAYHVSKICRVAYACTCSFEEYERRKKRLKVKESHSWSWSQRDLHELMRVIEREGSYSLLVIDAFDDLETPHRRWGDIIGFAEVKGMTVWCCARERGLLDDLRQDAAELTIAEAESEAMERAKRRRAA